MVLSKLATLSVPTDITEINSVSSLLSFATGSSGSGISLTEQSAINAEDLSDRLADSLLSASQQISYSYFTQSLSDILQTSAISLKVAFLILTILFNFNNIKHFNSFKALDKIYGKNDSSIKKQ